jgi:hypothetical protein
MTSSGASEDLTHSQTGGPCAANAKETKIQTHSFVLDQRYEI